MKIIGFDERTVRCVQFRSLGGKNGAAYVLKIPADMVAALEWDTSSKDKPILIELRPETRTIELKQVNADEYAIVRDGLHRWVPQP